MNLRAATTPLLRGWTPPNVQKLPYPAFVSGEGVYLQDSAGKTYLDAKSLMLNVAFGHGLSQIADAAAEQARQLPYLPTMDGHENPPADELARRLVELAPDHLTRVYLSTSGTAACEVAVMLTRVYWRLRGAPEKTNVVTLDRGYHGQSMGMTAYSGFEVVREDFGPLLGGTSHVPPAYCHRCPYELSPESCQVECAAAFEKRILELGPENVGAVMIEPVVGAIVQPQPPGYMERLQVTCDKYDVLLINDEVITAFGRVGAHFASEAMGTRPDFICLGKALTNGALPLAATLVSERVWQAFVENDHELYFGSTQDGNPTCAAAALATLNTYAQRDWSAQSARQGERLLTKLREKLADVPTVADVRGVGLFLAIEFAAPQSGEPIDITQQGPSFLEAGILVHLEGNLAVLCPPLCIGDSEIDDLVERLRLGIAIAKLC